MSLGPSLPLSLTGTFVRQYSRNFFFESASFLICHTMSAAIICNSSPNVTGPSGTAPALGALDPQHVQLADQVAEDDRAVAAHRCAP